MSEWFTGKDFMGIGKLLDPGRVDTGDAAAIIANAIVKKKLEEAPKVYGFSEIMSYPQEWGPKTIWGNTHTARLVDIQGIES